MRVLMLSLEYPPYIRGGLGEHVQHLVPALLAADSRLEVHVLAPDYDGRSRRETAGRLTVDRVAVPRSEAGAYFSSVQAANKRFADAAVAIIININNNHLLHDYYSFLFLIKKLFSVFKNGTNCCFLRFEFTKYF